MKEHWKKIKAKFVKPKCGARVHGNNVHPDLVCRLKEGHVQWHCNTVRHVFWGQDFSSICLYKWSDAYDGKIAEVAEWADALDSKPSTLNRCEGSTPSLGTN